MPDLYSLVKPFLWRLDPERAHRLSILALKTIPPQILPVFDSFPALEQSLWGKCFKSPIGLAAGYDKDAEAVESLLSLGFGFVEIGGVTLRPQGGNPPPRLFRLTEDRAVINRMGLNSAGVDMVVQRLQKFSDYPLPGPLAINLGLNKDSQNPPADYAALAGRLAPFAEILTLNVSSPNTPGLRALQDPGKLTEIVDSVRTSIAGSNSSSGPALLVKIAPDLSDRDVSDLAEFSLSHEIDGLVVANTTVARPASLRSVHREEAGGLSGAPLFNASTNLLRTMYKRTEGKIPIVGVGGISSGAEAYAKIRAGASLVQLYSAMVFEGPGLIGRITKELACLLEKDGLKTIEDAVGADHPIGEDS